MKPLTGIFICIVFWLVLSLMLFMSFEARYQALLKHYPHLKRWEVVVYGYHLILPTQEKEKA